MANLSGEITLELVLDERARETHTTYEWAGGGRVLTIDTTAPERGLALEVVSTYLGHEHTPTFVVHLVLGPVGAEPLLRSAQREHQELDPVEQPRACVYDHAQELIDVLSAAGHRVRVGLDEPTFAELERVE